jgi:RNA polymerase sigma-70 factor (ECF subfamily)
MPATALRVDESSFRACIEKYAKDLCRRWHIPRGDVDDLVQEVLTEILASLGSFSSDKGNFVNWTRGIAWKVIRRYGRDSQRHAKRFAEYPSGIDEFPAPDPSAEQCLQREQARRTVSKAVENLPAREAEVLLLHAVNGMVHRDIGQKLDISESASQKCFQRTRDKLAECLSDELRCAVPPFATGCDEPASREGVSRWHERSHYAGQVTATILAFLMFVASNQAPLSPASATGQIPASGPAQITEMYQLDKHSDVHDEPAVLRDAPSVKLEPASLPSVRAVSTPTSVVDKPAPFPLFGPLPSRKYTPRTSDHPPRGK